MIYPSLWYSFQKNSMKQEIYFRMLSLSIKFLPNPKHCIMFSKILYQNCVTKSLRIRLKRIDAFHYIFQAMNFQMSNFKIFGDIQKGSPISATSIEFRSDDTSPSLTANLSIDSRIHQDVRVLIVFLLK